MTTVSSSSPCGCYITRISPEPRLATTRTSGAVTASRWRSLCVASRRSWWFARARRISGLGLLLRRQMLQLGRHRPYRCVGSAAGGEGRHALRPFDHVGPGEVLRAVAVLLGHRGNGWPAEEMGVAQRRLPPRQVLQRQVALGGRAALDFERVALRAVAVSPVTPASSISRRCASSVARSLSFVRPSPSRVGPGASRVWLACSDTIRSIRASIARRRRHRVRRSPHGS